MSQNGLLKHLDTKRTNQKKCYHTIIILLLILGKEPLCIALFIRQVSNPKYFTQTRKRQPLTSYLQLGVGDMTKTVISRFSLTPLECWFYHDVCTRYIVVASLTIPLRTGFISFSRKDWPQAQPRTKNWFSQSALPLSEQELTQQCSTTWLKKHGVYTTQNNQLYFFKANIAGLWEVAKSINMTLKTHLDN